MPIEQFIHTTNPQRYGSFQTLAKSNGYNQETNALVRAGYITFQSAVLRGDGYEEQTSRDKVLKSGAKKNIFGRYGESQYEYVDTVVRGKIEVVAESQPGPLPRSDDYRENPENAPYRLAKMTLADGRLLVARFSGIGRVYSNDRDGVDNRTGNFFEHAFIFPAGTNLTNEQIKNLPFQKGLPAQKWRGGISPVLPSLTNDQIFRAQKAGASASPVQEFKVPKTVRYGTVVFLADSPLGEIEDLVCNIGIQQQLMDSANKENDEYSADYHGDRLADLGMELIRKMQSFPQKGALKTFLQERAAYYREEKQKCPPEDRQNYLYQELASNNAKRTFVNKIEKTKN